MITKVNITSSQLQVTKDSLKKNVLSKLSRHQLVSARVVEQLPDGKVKLMLQGQQVTAKTLMNLKPGEEVQLRVLQEKDNVVLKLIEPARELSSKQISTLIRFFSGSKSMPDPSKISIPNVKALLNEISLKSGKSDPEFLPRLLNKIGLSWEKKISDLSINSQAGGVSKFQIDKLISQDMKANILKLLLFGEAQRVDPSATALSFHDSVENFQQLNHHSSDSGRYLLPFPVFSESGFNFGQLLIDLGNSDQEDGDNEKRVINISFLLEMSELGPLRADFSILNKEITGCFLLQDDKIRHFVQTMIPELKTRLSNLSYNVHKIDCLVAKPADIEPNCLVETILKETDDNVLNIII
jgi:hypothetical protein